MEKLPKRSESFADWYHELVVRADLAEHAPVRGCMIIKPYGYAIWEKMQRILDQKFKETGHVNAYFPLFIPQSFLSREAQHVEGFAKECAVVTHHRLRATLDGKSVEVDPEARLQEPLIVRPTSETIIWSTYKNWIRSYRDLPILINQWANVVRWELRPRLFLRTAEFLWQEGHTAHETKEEALKEARQMLEIYAQFAEEYMAVPVIKGVKTPSERFAGAEETFTIEALMQDGKALQMGTSHFLGQNFAKAFDVTFLNRNNEREYVWATSWGVSTRLIGALIMVHGDDQGLRLPPALAPIQIVLIPIYKTEEERNNVLETLHRYKKLLQSMGFSVYLDDDERRRPGWKFAQWELKGVPLRIALGPKDLANEQVEGFRRDTNTKFIIAKNQLQDKNYITELLSDIQKTLFQQARERMQAMTHEVEDYEAFKAIIEEQGGFIYAGWDGSAETESIIKEETKATIRCIPFEGSEANGLRCIRSGKPARYKVYFAKAY